MLSDDAKLQVLHDHYKESFREIQNHRHQRDRLFTQILLLAAIVLFQVFSPKLSGEVISEFISQKLGLGTAPDISFVGSIIWFGLFGLVVRYFQTVVLMERQYQYLHGLEDQLSKQYDGSAFTREGKAYLSDYPIFSQWASALYTAIFPAVLLLVVFAKTFNDISLAQTLSFLLCFEIAVALCIVISMVLYLAQVYFQK